MKKFTVKATALAIASVCGSAAFAGSITAPTTVTTYAVEGLVNTTDITSPAVTYKMGVARTVAQDFTVVVKPSSGAAFTAGSCAAALPVIAAANSATGAATVTVKRSSAAECAYEVDVTTAFSAPTVDGLNYVTLTATGLVFDSHTLATVGNNVGVTVGLWDLGETARIDNSADVTVTVGNSAAALSLTAAADTGTKADVNYTNGPLFGFVIGNDDLNTVAAAGFAVNNNTSNYVKPDGATVWNFGTDGTSIVITVAGTNFTGLAANSPVTVVAPAGNNPVATTTATQSTFTILPANITALGANNFTVKMAAAGNTTLGTTRTFGISGLADVVTGADQTLAGNNSWWQWSANAIQLSTPYFSTDAGTGVLTRFFFQNLGPAATYTASCQVETGKTATTGTAASGTLVAGQTVIDAKDVCSFSAGIRGAVTFTINAPAANIKGAYNLGFNGSAASFIPLERPYANGTY